MLAKLFKKAVLVLCIASASYNAYAFEVGVNVHLNEKNRDSDYYLQLLNQYGFTSLRGEFPWQQNELAKGEYKVGSQLVVADNVYASAKSERGISPLVVIDYSNKLYAAYRDYPRTPEAIQAFANYAYWVASKYKGKVKYYEVWNEWLNGTGLTARPLVLPSPDVYYNLVKATYQAIKRADPNAIVMTGSFNPGVDKDRAWFDEQIKLGILNYIDGITIHPYNYRFNNVDDRTAEANIKMITAYHDNILRTQGKDMPIYITEMGVPNYQGKGGLSREDAAKFVVKYTLLAKSNSFIKGVWWYDLKDDGNNPNINENNFGMLDYNGRPKLAMLDLEKTIALLKSHNLSKVTYGSDGRVTIMLDRNNQNSYVYWYQKKNENKNGLTRLFSTSANAPIPTYNGLVSNSVENHSDISDGPKIITPSSQ